MLVGLALSMLPLPTAQAQPAVPAHDEPASGPVTILMSEYALSPIEIEATAGALRLRLVNVGIRRHTLTVLIDGVEHSSPEVRPGDAAEWLLQIERTGQYAVWCNEYRHLEKGMGATLVIR
jgi:uncharacterized cupredoxin-like copper-binding protein